MTMILLLTGCLIEQARYEARLAELVDADGDGVSIDAGDCDDADPARFPGATDACDGVDDDCDGVVDEDAVDRTWYADADGDGYGAPSATASGCAAPEGFVAEATDCDDADGGIHPAATDEPYDGVDQDCAGGDLVDVDGDGDAAATAGGGDCADDDAARSTLVTEAWGDDGVDNDCDGDAFDPVAWDAGEATARLDGPEPGVEMGRRVSAWVERGCLLPTAPYADESRGAIYAEPAGPGIRTAGSGGAVHGLEPYAFLTGLGVREDGLLIAGSLTADGRGRVWILDADALCDGATADLAGAGTSIGGEASDDFFGVHARWLPDIDGDGLDDLVVAATGHDGPEEDEGAISFFLGADGASGSIRAADADLTVRGGFGGATLSDVVVAGDRDRRWLFFSRANGGPGGVALVRVPVDGLASGNLDDLGDGGVATEGTWLAPTVVGDTNNDGGDELVLSESAWTLWEATAIVGVQDDADATTRIATEDTAEWITGVTALGDIDGGGRADLLVLGDDWPTGSSRGRAALLPGEDLLPGQINVVERQRRHATGAELGDVFGYRALPVGDTDGDGAPEIAVAAYGTDHGGASAGSVYLLPLPTGP